MRSEANEYIDDYLSVNRKELKGMMPLDVDKDKAYC